jgi:hypothetical protein
MYQDDYYEDEPHDDLHWEYNPDEEDKLPPTQPPRKHWWHRKRWLIIIAIIGLVCAVMIPLLPQWQEAKAVMPTYLGLNHQLAAQVQITGTRRPQTLVVHVTFYGMNRKVRDTHDCYIKQGNTLTFLGNTLNFAAWLNSFSLHSGYKLIEMDGCCPDPDCVNSNIPFIPGKGEDGFFTDLQEHPWVFSTASANPGQFFSLPAVQLKPNQTKTFNLYTSSNGLRAVLVP